MSTHLFKMSNKKLIKRRMRSELCEIKSKDQFWENIGLLREFFLKVPMISDIQKRVILFLYRLHINSDYQESSFYDSLRGESQILYHDCCVILRRMDLIKLDLLVSLHGRIEPRERLFNMVAVKVIHNSQKHSGKKVLPGAEIKYVLPQVACGLPQVACGLPHLAYVLPHQQIHLPGADDL